MKKVNEIPVTGVRIPQELKQQLTTLAKENSRSFNNEVLHRLKESVKDKS